MIYGCSQPRELWFIDLIMYMYIYTGTCDTSSEHMYIYMYMNIELYMCMGTYIEEFDDTAGYWTIIPLFLCYV